MVRNLALVRADVSRLPFQSGSVDAVHAGAALHCWPSPSNAVSDLSSFDFVLCFAYPASQISQIDHVAQMLNFSEFAKVMEFFT